MKRKTFKILLFTVLFVSCSKHDVEEIMPGETTVVEAVNLLGEPLKVSPSSFNKSDEMFHFEQGVIQVEKKQVKVVFRKPLDDEEENLQFWREKFKENKSEWNPVRAPSGIGLFELKYPEKGTALIYDSNVEKVIKVIKYEPKK